MSAEDINSVTDSRPVSITSVFPLKVLWKPLGSSLSSGSSREETFYLRRLESFLSGFHFLNHLTEFKFKRKSYSLRSSFSLLHGLTYQNFYNISAEKISQDSSIWITLHVHVEPSATMMFCTTFLSSPSEDHNCEGGGGTSGGGLGPGSCLSSLHCLVLPQDELYPPLSDSTTRLSICPDERARSLVGKVLLDVSLTTCTARQEGGCIWDRVRRRRSRSASPSPTETPKSPRPQSVRGTCCSWGTSGSSCNKTTLLKVLLRAAYEKCGQHLVQICEPEINSIEVRFSNRICLCTLGCFSQCAEPFVVYLNLMLFGCMCIIELVLADCDRLWADYIAVFETLIHKQQKWSALLQWKQSRLYFEKVFRQILKLYRSYSKPSIILSHVGL